MTEGRVGMSQRDLQRLQVMQAVIAKRITQVEASRCLGLSARQFRRLQRRVRHEGPAGLVHRSRGRPSPRRLSADLATRAVALIRTRYPDFGPTLACEPLATQHPLAVSVETLRQWMRQAGLWAGRRRARPHRQWRERKACRGELVQLDGSHHAWLEGRGPRLVLLAYVDDATSRLWARFYPAEGTAPAMDSFRRYCQRAGVPQAVYLDRHTTYKASRPPTLAEQLAGQEPQSQFQRALAQLGVQVVHAYSPQAKGRVERVFKTLQDRLVKALRLAGAGTLPAANRVLGAYLQPHNQRFAVAPRQPADLHRPAPPTRVLRQILCVQEPRTVAPDGTIQVQQARRQLHGQRPRSQVLVRWDRRGRVQVFAGTQQLAARPVAASPPRPARRRGRRQRLVRPAADHPWKQTPACAGKRTFSCWQKADISILG